MNEILGSTFRQILWRRALEIELTYSQSQVLFYVEQHPGCHMGEVAKAFAVTLAAVTQIVDRLEQKKFLVRSSDPADRRAYTLALTPEGRDLVAELHTLQTEGLGRVLAKMSGSDRARLVKGLEALVQAAADAEQPGAAPRPGRRGRSAQGEPGD